MASAAWISAAGKIPLLGSALRRVARRYPEGSVTTIPSGHAAGMRWRRHHRYVSGYWLGHYELDIQEALVRNLRAGQVFYDVGANAGFFTLVASRHVGADGKCVAFDPSPENCASIGEQIELNGLRQCIVVQQAVGGAEGRGRFSFAAPGSPQGKLGDDGSVAHHIEVSVTTLDRAAASHGPPDLIKMDIEGAEVEALAGARATLRDHRPKWLIELHGPECERGVKAVLTDASYLFMDVGGRLVAGDLPKHVLAVPRETFGTK